MVSIFRPEIIHSHHLWLLTALARERCADIPMVASCHSTDLRQFRQCPQYRQAVAPACRRLQRVLALGPSQRQEIVALHGIDEGRIDIVGAGFDEELFTWGEKAPPPPVELLYAGKLSLAKGVDLLLGAFAGLSASGLHLHLAGSAAGPEGELCRGLAARCGSAVTLHGPLDQRRLAKLMRRCHIFVLPSFAEGLPLVVLEAMASGCRLIVSDLPGCREALQGFDPRRVAFLQLPPLGGDGRPEPANMAALQGRLAALIELMAQGVGEEGQVDGAEAAGIAAGYGWRAVFARIERSYARAVAG
jgi:glycosyltransferase involved in cell wall biosynthesis